MAEIATEAEVEEDEESGAEEGDGEAGGEFVAEAEFPGGCGHPIEERGLFEPGLVIEAGGDPISGVRHGAADGGVAGFVGRKEGDIREAVE